MNEVERLEKIISDLEMDCRIYSHTLDIIRQQWWYKIFKFTLKKYY